MRALWRRLRGRCVACGGYAFGHSRCHSCLNASPVWALKRVA